MLDSVPLERDLQTMYHRNMEFFSRYNHRLFLALKESPKAYNLHIDSRGINILNTTSNALQYPFINGLSSMLDSHKDLSIAPMRNAKWDLVANMDFDSLFFNEERFNITGKYANAMIKLSLKDTIGNMQSNCNPNSMDYKALHNRLIECMLNNFEHSKFLPQTAIYGLMGGIFLQDLLDKGYTFHSLIIYEEHIDLFRISLYFLDYARLFISVSDRSCFIAIKDISDSIIRAFIYNKKITNSLLSLELKHYDSNNVSMLRSLLLKEKKSAMRGWGSFEDEKIGLLNAKKNLQHCKILSSKIDRVNAPICVVGNGASLDLSLDFIKAYKDNMIIFSCGTALSVLRHHDIKPDFQIEIERIDYLAQVLKDSRLEDIPLLYAQTTDCKAVGSSVESYAFMRGGSASAYVDSGILALEFSAPFVGNAGVALALLLGSDCILCGIDCGYILGYGKHAKHSFYGDETTQIPHDCFLVDGNKNLSVYSNDIYYLSARNIEEAIKLYKCNNVINLGYGIRLQGALNISGEDFNLRDIDKQKELARLKGNFYPYSLHMDSALVCKHLSDFRDILKDLLYKDGVENLAGIFTLVDHITQMLHKHILDTHRRVAIIMIEGSCLHLCLSMLKSFIFSDSKAHFDIMREYFLDALDCIIGDLARALCIT